MNKEAQLATMLVVGLALALFGWALVYLASSLAHPKEEQRAVPTRLRQWLNAAYDRLLKAENDSAAAADALATQRPG